MKKNIVSLIALFTLCISSSFTKYNPVSEHGKHGITSIYVWPDDEDEDGVPDIWDKCPHTPPLVPVDPDGCPLIIIP